MFEVSLYQLLFYKTKGKLSAVYWRDPISFAELQVGLSENWVQIILPKFTCLSSWSPFELAWIEADSISTSGYMQSRKSWKIPIYYDVFPIPNFISTYKLVRKFRHVSLRKGMNYQHSINIHQVYNTPQLLSWYPQYLTIFLGETPIYMTHHDTKTKWYNGITISRYDIHTYGSLLKNGDTPKSSHKSS